MIDLHSKGHFIDEMLSEKPYSDMISETNRIFSNAVTKGITTEIPSNMQTSLGNDVFLFSGCKTYIELKEASLLLWDKDRNQVKPFNRFYNDVQTLHNNYDKNYLDAEYYYARSSAQSAAQWVQYEADGDDYDLQYRTAGDNKVRDEHEKLDRITLPPSDDFWKEYYPPNGWRCRCGAKQVRKGKYKNSNSSEAIDEGNAATLGNNEIFRFNPGQQKIIFPPHHPYFKVKKQIGDVLSSVQEQKASLTEKLRTQRLEVKSWAKQNLIGQTATNRHIDKPVKFTLQGIKEAINQPHKHILKKNEAVKEITNLINEAKYLPGRTTIDDKRGFKFHYLETRINNEASYIVLKESMNGDLNFYTITDNIKE